MKKCTNCGADVEDGVKFCPNCGARLESTGYQADSTPTLNSSYVSYPKHHTGSDIASMVLGILSLVFTSFVGIVLGTIGLCLAIKGKKEKRQNGYITAGFVCSLIGLILGAIIFIVMIIVIVEALQYGDVNLSVYLCDLMF